jgi:hypothetical protein
MGEGLLDGLYKGAWQEWNIEEIEMAIPMSPGQVLQRGLGSSFTNPKKTWFPSREMITVNSGKERRTEMPIPRSNMLNSDSLNTRLWRPS